jgi:hypothetical protein
VIALANAAHKYNYRENDTGWRDCAMGACFGTRECVWEGDFWNRVIV